MTIDVSADFKDDVRNLITGEYPDFESNDFSMNGRLFSVKNVINEEEEEDTLDFLNSFIMNYYIYNNYELPSVDDVINITCSYKSNPQETKELRVENYNSYLSFIKNIELKDIFPLNKIIIHNDIIERLKIIEQYYSNKEDYIDYCNEITMVLLLHYRILMNNGISKEVALDKIKKEIILSLDNKIRGLMLNKNKIKSLKKDKKEEVN